MLNPAARHGTAARRFARLEPTLGARFDLDWTRLDSEGAWIDALVRAFASGIRIVAAAGGDGTVNAIASALRDRRPAPLEDIRLGAIGLGSSNDFHKPISRRIGGVPIRLDPDAAAPRDIGRVRYEDAEGEWRERIFLVSASLGATAAANAFFNRGDVVLTRLKRVSPSAAIGYAALRTLARHRSFRARLRMAGLERSVELANLGVLKTPHLAGWLVYDTPVDPCSGLLAVNLSHGMGRVGLVRTLAALSRGRFTGRPGAFHQMVDRLEVDVDVPTALELDGEITTMRRAIFDVLPDQLMVCA